MASLASRFCRDLIVLQQTKIGPQQLWAICAKTLITTSFLYPSPRRSTQILRTIRSGVMDQMDQMDYIGHNESNGPYQPTQLEAYPTN